MSKTLNLSTTHGYPFTFIKSHPIDVVGYDAFVSVDFTRSAVPEVNLVGFTVSAHPQDRKTKYRVGDKVFIGDKTYELVCDKVKYIRNGDIKLVEIVK